MKDADSLNTILGYAKHVEGTQHSEHLSKVNLDTIKIPNANVKVEAISQKRNGSNKRHNSKHRSQIKGKPNKGNCCNCGTSHPPKKCPVYGKTCYSCNKKGLTKLYCRSRQSGNGGLTQTSNDSPDMINMKLQETTGTKVMTQTGSNMNKTLCKYCLVKVYVQTLTLSQTFSLMKLMVKEFNLCLLT